jgi:YaaC-like protein
MPFKDSIKENLWFALLSYEYERHVRDLLLKGLSEGWLDWTTELGTQTEEQKREYLEKEATPFICLSLRQSKELFTAAEQASDVTKPLLSYYGMLNLVKGMMAVDAPDFFQDRDNLQHGLSPREGAKDKFTFQEERIVLHPDGVYSLGRKAVGQSSVCADNERVVLNIADIFKALPDLYWDYMKLGSVEPKHMNTFHFGLPERQFNSYSQQFYVNTFIDRTVYEDVKARLPVSLEEKFMFELQGTSLHLKSKLNTGNVQELVNLLDSFSTLLWSTNTRFVPLKFDCVIEGPQQGATRTEQLAFTELEMLYILMFYMSTLARYRPHIWDAAISGKENEFVTVFKKFLYYADGKFIALISTRVNRLA